MVKLVKKRVIGESLQKAKELEKGDLYTLKELKKEDNWFLIQAKKLPMLLARFPRIQKKTKPVVKKGVLKPKKTKK